MIARDDGRETAALRNAVVAIGNFDGVHRGHRAVIDAAIARARALGRPAAALTFEPHPLRFFRPEVPAFQLTDEAAKLRLLASTGLDGAVVLTFDAALANLTADEFIARVLVERLAVAGAVIGFNFHFGKNRAGSPELPRCSRRETRLSRRYRPAAHRCGPAHFLGRDPRSARRGTRDRRGRTCSAFPGSSRAA